MIRGIYTDWSQFSICDSDILRRDFYIFRGDTFCRAVRVMLCGDIPAMLGDAGFVLFGIALNGVVIKVKKYTARCQRADGFIPFGLTSGEVAELEPGEYEYEIEFNLPKVITAMKGKITIDTDLITPEVRNGS